jgi:phospholipid/cholesterol/gamma-HCH transport system ATP-binding protein
VITLHQISKSFSGHFIFKDISFHVPKSGSVVVLGPSGSGKSVLLKVMAGLIPPDSGRVEIASKNIGMLFQKSALFDSLSVEENLLFPLREKLGVTGLEAKKKTSSLLEAVGLGHALPLFPHEISGGMQKRLGIARALVVDPEVIFYDEPTAGLDPITSRTIADLILKLRKERGTTLVTVTNDIERAYQLGDRIFLLALEKLTEGGTPDEVRKTALPALRQFIYGLQQGPLT